MTKICSTYNNLYYNRQHSTLLDKVKFRIRQWLQSCSDLQRLYEDAFVTVLQKAMHMLNM